MPPSSSSAQAPLEATLLRLRYLRRLSEAAVPLLLPAVAGRLLVELLLLEQSPPKAVLLQHLRRTLALSRPPATRHRRCLAQEALASALGRSIFTVSGCVGVA